MRFSRVLAVLGGLLLTAASLRAIPLYDHVVVVVLENHGYQQILDGPAPFINFTLRAQGADLLAFGIQHPSQPNYYWLFSGSNQGLLDDTAPTAPFTGAPSLYTSLVQAGRTFGGYVDGYPGPANQYTDTANYVVRHVPWLGFSTVPATLTRAFTSFPQAAAGFEALPTVSFVIPGLDHDMHDYNSGGGAVGNPEQSAIAVQNGDLWLQQNLRAYYEWAKTHNSLLILTFDEDSTSDWTTPPLAQTNADGFTSPALGPNPAGDNGPNQITTLFAGAGIVPGLAVEGVGSTNVNVLRTIEAIYDLPRVGAQAPLATAAGISDKAISRVFVPPIPRVKVNGRHAFTVASRALKLRGTATDQYGVLAAVQVKLNQGAFQKARGKATWSRGVHLRPGRNVLRVRAVDRDGTRSPVVKLVVTRAIAAGA